MSNDAPEPWGKQAFVKPQYLFNQVLRYFLNQATNSIKTMAFITGCLLFLVNCIWPPS